MIFYLPYPPTVNTYYTVARGRKVLSQRGRKYKTIAVNEVLAQKTTDRIMEGRVSISIQLSPPDKRVRDLDNCLKPILDVLSEADVWVDDSQVKRIKADMLDKCAGGSCVVIVEENRI